MLPSITIPTLLLYGESDQRAPRDVADDLHAQIPGSEFALLLNAGHDSNLEAPTAFNDSVRHFLRKHA